MPVWLPELLAVPRATVAGVVITRDEAATIFETVRRLRPAVDRVLVVDTGSTDDTVRLSREAGAEVLAGPWENDFSAARNFALGHVTEDWVLWVDADEWLYPEDVDVPRWVAGLFHDRGPLVVRIVQMNKQGDRLVPFYAGSRMFPTGYGLRWWGMVHEQGGPSSGGPYSAVYPRPPARIRVYHEGYDASVMARKPKLQRNIRLLRLQLARDPDDITAQGLLGRELFLVGQTEDAIAAYRATEAMADRFPTYGALSDTRYGLVQALMKTGQFSEALAIADRLTGDDPGFPGGWYAKGQAELGWPPSW
jgi:tetratricopeptide (TPR) repeat protein